MEFVSKTTDRIHQYLAERFGEEIAREAGPIAAFVGGFIWDAATLSRVDQWLDLTILTFYLIGSFVMLALLGFSDGFFQNRMVAFIRKHGAFIFHFFIGGLFSAFVVFVFKSVTFSKSLIFLGLIAGVFVLNEWAAHRETPQVARMAMLHLAAFMYFVFVLPIGFARMDYPVFFAAGIISTSLIMALLFLNTKGKPFFASKENKQVTAAALALLLFMNGFYFLKWIPPVPLVLKEAALAINVKKEADGTYIVQKKETPWWIFWRDYKTEYALSETSRLYCFASVFAPTRLQTTLVHEWRWKDPKKGWVVVDRLPYSISGGRDGGYRGYTYKSTLREGDWSVHVTTADGRLVGKMDFTVVP
jgi:hypothetical protein